MNLYWMVHLHEQCHYVQRWHCSHPDNTIHDSLWTKQFKTFLKSLFVSYKTKNKMSFPTFNTLTTTFFQYFVYNAYTVCSKIKCSNTEITEYTIPRMVQNCSNWWIKHSVYITIAILSHLYCPASKRISINRVLNGNFN